MNRGSATLGSEAMRVGFDMAPSVIPHSRGVGRVCTSLVQALERRARIEVVRLSPAPCSNLRRWRQAELPELARKGGLLGLHSFTSAFPLRGPGRRVQTVHELPWLHGVRENAGWRHRAWARLGRLCADRVVTPTEHVARQLRRRSFGSAEIRTVPWGVDGATFSPEPPLHVIDEAVLERHRLGDAPYLFVAGADRQKKNLAGVLHGLAALKRRGETRLHLVVTGKDTPDLRRDLGLATRLGLSRWLSTLEEVPDDDYPSLVRLAEAVCVLSHSEGFGLTVLEALACGTPVLVPHGSAQAEVAGAAGFVCDAASEESVADAIEEAQRERHARMDVALDRAGELSWERSAEHIEALWKELA